MELKEFTIPFTGLKLGEHEWVYKIDNAFFESFEYNEYNESSVKTTAKLVKMAHMMELEMKATGSVNVNCDLTGVPFDQEVDSQLHLVIKFGAEFNNEDDEILILPHGEYQINIAQYIYEMLVLGVPQKRVHPGVEDGTLKSDILDKLKELEPKGENPQTGNIDPRWDKLKNLLTDK